MFHEWLPTPEDEKLKTWLYRIEVPWLHSLSEEQIRQRGVRVTGDRAIDEFVKEQWISRFASTQCCFALFDRGVSFRVQDFNERTDMYETVQRYLRYIVEGLHFSTNARGLNAGMFLTIEHFAQSLFETLDGPTPEVESPLKRQQNQLFPLNASNLLKPLNSLPTPEPVHQRTRFYEVFQRLLNNQALRYGPSEF